MRNALFFLGKFVVISGLFYGVWEILAPFYLTLVVPVVNALFSGLQLPVQLELRGSILLLIYQQGGGWLRLQAHDYDIIYLNLIAATALLAASPGQSVAWKLRWAGAVLVLLWTTHVASFFIGGQIAIWEYLDGMPATLEKAALVEQMQVHFSLERRELLTALLAQWNIWGRYALAVGIWFVALRREISGWSVEFFQEPLGQSPAKVYRFRFSAPAKQRQKAKQTKLKRAS